MRYIDIVPVQIVEFSHKGKCGDHTQGVLDNVVVLVTQWPGQCRMLDQCLPEGTTKDAGSQVVKTSTTSKAKGYRSF